MPPQFVPPQPEVRSENIADTIRNNNALIGPVIDLSVPQAEERSQNFPSDSWPAHEDEEVFAAEPGEESE